MNYLLETRLNMSCIYVNCYAGEENGKTEDGLYVCNA